MADDDPDNGAGLMAGRLVLVAGVANRRSIAWAIAEQLHREGARLAFTYQGERLRDGVRRLAESVGSDVVVECDVGDDGSLDEAFAALDEALGGLDALVHSIAYAPAEAFAGRFADTSREAWHQALDISAYSLLAMAPPPRRCMSGSARRAIPTSE